MSIYIIEKLIVKDKIMTKVYTITHLRKLSPNSKAYKASMKRTSLTGNPDIYQATTKMMPKKDQKKVIIS